MSRVTGYSCTYIGNNMYEKIERKVKRKASQDSGGDGRDDDNDDLRFIECLLDTMHCVSMVYLVLCLPRLLLLFTYTTINEIIIEIY